MTELDQPTPCPVLLAGSHGGRYAAHLDLARGIRAALFHDAGIGKDNAAIACLEIFSRLGLPCGSVDSRSARIGNARDTMERGCISHANPEAQALGVEAGMGVADALSAFQGVSGEMAEEAVKDLMPGEEARGVVEI